jgi:hypothetical protein
VIVLASGSALLGPLSGGDALSVMTGADGAADGAGGRLVTENGAYGGFVSWLRRRRR